MHPRKENMENTNLPICSLCGKKIEPLGFEERIKLDHQDREPEFGIYHDYIEVKEFKEDIHLKCRIRCARYYCVGLRSRWLSTDPFIVTNNNNVAYEAVEKIKRMSYKEMQSNGIYLYGQPGTGKTHLLADLCRSVIDRTNLANISWVNTSSILTKLRSSFGKKYEYGEETDQENFLNRLRVQFLFLDDLGTETATEWAKEILYEAINYRYEEQLPLFVTSNLSSQELAEKMGDKFTSRIIETCKSLKIEGEDRRLQNADKRNQGVEIKKTEIPVFSYRMAYWHLTDLQNQG